MTVLCKQSRDFYSNSVYLTCPGSLAFPVVGLRGFGVDGASPVLEDPGSSFLRVGARSNPFPWGE